jgi:hypothetical protein
MSASTKQLIDALQPIVSRVRQDVTAIKVPEGGSRWTNEALTTARLAKHIEGGLPRGCGLIKAGEDTTRLALFDLDSHKGATPWAEMASTAATITNVAAIEGIYLTAFRSSGGHGIHLYAIWDEPQDAFSVRQAMTAVLTAAGLESGTKGLQAGEVEVFPKQNSVPADGYGNQFILPLAGKSVPLSFDFFPLPVEATLTTTWTTSLPVARLAKPERPIFTGANTVEFEALQRQLDAIPNAGIHELDYDQWRNIIFAIHHETQGSDEGLALAHEFSSRASKYDPDLLDNRIWPYITSDRDSAITGRTVLYMAREHGYVEDMTDEFDELPPVEPAERLPSPRFSPIAAAAFAVTGHTRWLVKGVLPAADLAVLYGASGSGKTFVALDMAIAIARGVPWRGCRTAKGRVAYVCAEGAGGFRRRLQAYAEYHGVPLEEIDLFVIPAAPNLLKGDDVRDLVKALQANGHWALVILDTFAQVMPGGNENSGEDVGMALSHCKVISTVLGCPVLLIHHSGKDETRGARGWSGLRAACDTEMEVIRVEHERALTVTKQKDGEEGQDYGFKLETVALGVDQDGDPITSCAVIHTENTAKAIRKMGRKLGNVEQVVYQTLLDSAELAGGGMDREALLMAVIEKLDRGEGQKDRRRQRAVRALDELLASNRIVNRDGQCVLSGEGEE